MSTDSSTAASPSGWPITPPCWLPTVVLGKAEVRFLKPVKAGEKLTARAEVIEDLGRKKLVKAEVFNEKNEKVFEGTFHCYVLERHVLE